MRCEVPIAVMWCCAVTRLQSTSHLRKTADLLFIQDLVITHSMPHVLFMAIDYLFSKHNTMMVQSKSGG
jgi:hypothetical protein